MDKPNSPGGLGGSGSSWPENSGSDQDFGATGVFGAVTLPDSAPPTAKSRPESDFLASWATEPPPPPAPKPIAEPVVHKVVLEGGAGASSPELLDRMRAASAERPAAPDPAKGSGGFTELLRTLGTESPAPAPKQPPPPPASSGFTSLLQTLGTAGTSPAPLQPHPPRLPRMPLHRPAGLQNCSAQRQSQAEPQTQSLHLRKISRELLPSYSVPWAVLPLPRPRRFRLAARPLIPHPPVRAPSPRCSHLSSSRLRSSPSIANSPRPLLAVLITACLQQLRGPRKPTVILLLHRPRPRPQKPAPPGSSVGITRLIQMLDEPSKQPLPQRSPVPTPPPRAAEPGVWTQTFASLSMNSEPASPAPAAPLAAPAYPAFVPPPAVNPQPVAPPASGPSEFTRILDASRIRELSMQGGAAPQNLAPPPPQNLAAPPQFTPPPMPSYPMPATPPPPSMQGFGAMPQPGAFPPPPQPPAYPCSLVRSPHPCPCRVPCHSLECLRPHPSHQLRSSLLSNRLRLQQVSCSNSYPCFWWSSSFCFWC
jgi:hypothetical protein